MNRQSHWERVYESKPATAMSWYQPLASASLELIEATGVDRHAALLDVGGGASTLVDGLLDRGYDNITVLDIAEAGLRQARERLRGRAASVRWRVADITMFHVEHPCCELWHDRAALHFLTAQADRRRYAEVLHEALRPGGWAILGTFALDGPARCSDLEVRRHSSGDLAALLGSEFELVESRLERHTTPWGREQPFSWARLRRREARR